MRTFFVDNKIKNSFRFKLLVRVHSYSSPHSVWTSSWLDWKSLFLKLHTDTFLSVNFDNDMSTVFVDNPDQKLFLFQKLLRCIHSYSSPHFIWTNSWLDWRKLFVKLHTENFIRAKSDNDMSTFFVDNQDQTILLFQNLLFCIHSCSSPHFIWKSSWLDWKTLFVKLHTDTFFKRKIWQRHENFFVDNQIKNSFWFKLLVSIHSYSSPHSVWTSSWLDWKSLFLKLHTDTFLSAKFDNDLSTVFVDNPDQKILSFQNLLGCIHSTLALIFFEKVVD